MAALESYNMGVEAGVERRWRITGFGSLTSCARGRLRPPKPMHSQTALSGRGASQGIPPISSRYPAGDAHPFQSGRAPPLFGSVTVAGNPRENSRGPSPNTQAVRSYGRCRALCLAPVRAGAGVQRESTRWPEAFIVEALAIESADLRRLLGQPRLLRREQVAGIFRHCRGKAGVTGLAGQFREVRRLQAAFVSCFLR